MTREFQRGPVWPTSAGRATINSRHSISARSAGDGDDSNCPSLCRRGQAAQKCAFEIQRWIREVDQFGVPRFGEFGHRLNCYRNLLAGEFANEEYHGQLSDVEQRHPECKPEITELHGQHGQFLDQLERFADRLQQDQPAYRCWQDAVAEFEHLISEIARHQGREDQLLESLTPSSNAVART